MIMFHCFLSSYTLKASPLLFALFITVSNLIGNEKVCLTDAKYKFLDMINKFTKKYACMSSVIRQ